MGGAGMKCLPALAHDRLQLSEMEEEGRLLPSDEDGDAKRPSGLLFAALTTATFMGLSNGYYYAISYLISPVQDACRDAWSDSATTYGFAGSNLVLMASSVALPSVMSRTRSRTLLLAVVLLSALSCALSGLAVHFCQRVRPPILTEIVYIVALATYGVPSLLAWSVPAQILLDIVPHRPGFAGSVGVAAVSVGSEGFSQMILALGKVRAISTDAIFFAAGTVAVLLSGPFVFCVPDKIVGKSSVEEDTAIQKNTSSNSFISLLRHTSIGLMAVYLFGVLAPIMGVMAHLAVILTKTWTVGTTPIAILTGFAFAAHFGGRIVFMLTSDYIGLKRVCFISTAIQCTSLGILAWLSYRSYSSTWPEYVSATLICLYLFVCTACKSNIIGLAYLVCGKERVKKGIFSMGFVGGLASTVGPIFINELYKAFGSYFQFYVASSCLCLVSLVCLAFLKPLRRDDAESK